ncbi:MAG: nucleotide pyrophosphohydrolase [Nanoarchaeota archaeon]|nr:nucleotide pyrophosphohydrolase [Nanoarchaeota archaeon]MBU1269709.1 nucleotide pyrophosphohydrolase [Nanoarchaeota archaeon]MBU1604010.1 nucleotide pyrophosphohydrolase [Nanoarchaeota archaeon]MBU2442527.1 nucleotide pyrophosphohydrolase [Nanoarchaeota archaeon]
MKEKFQELYESLKIDRKNSEWSREHSMKERAEELYKEVLEIKQALENDDVKNLREELGDALWDLLFMIVIAEEQKLFSGKEVINDAMEKLKRRKPWIFTGKKLSKEEESKLWNEIKKKEKE